MRVKNASNFWGWDEFFMKDEFPKMWQQKTSESAQACAHRLTERTSAEGARAYITFFFPISAFFG